MFYNVTKYGVQGYKPEPAMRKRESPYDGVPGWFNLAD